MVINTENKRSGQSIIVVNFAGDKTVAEGR